MRCDALRCAWADPCEGDESARGAPVRGAAAEGAECLPARHAVVFERCRMHSRIGPTVASASALAVGVFKHSPVRRHARDGGARLGTAGAGVRMRMIVLACMRAHARAFFARARACACACACARVRVRVSMCLRWCMRCVCVRAADCNSFRCFRLGRARARSGSARTTSRRTASPTTG